jgi:uncharacterized protein (DUF983 family)
MNVRAVLRQVCPRCLRAKVWEGLWRMRAVCPECGLRFEREPGYFLGAMYYSYAISIAAGAPPAITGMVLDWPTWATGLAATAAIALASPISFRLSRVLWLHMDQAFDPR